MGLGGGGDFGASARRDEEQRQARIKVGTGEIDKAFAGFNPQFFQQRANDYYAFANPQLGRQFGQTRDAVMGDLANRGLFRSSARDRAVSNLNTELATQRQGIYDEGQKQAQQLQQNVEGSRANALQLLYQSADPGQAAGMAQRSAASAQAPSMFAPIGNLFSNLANMYYTRKLINTGNQSTGGGSSLSVNPGALP